MKRIRVTIRFCERNKRKRIRSVRFLREHDMALKRLWLCNEYMQDVLNINEPDKVVD